MTDVVLLRKGTDALVQFNWTDLRTGVSVSSVTHAVPSPLVKGTEQTSGANAFSVVKVGTGTAVHGARYTIDALATLSNGDVVPASIPVLVWDE